MPRYLIEGSCDGSQFAEAIDANSQEDAEALAIERLCEAWGEEYGPNTTLDDLGDAASVTEYSPADYAREAAADMLAALKALLPHVAAEIEQRKESGNAEYYADLEAAEALAIDAIMKAEGKRLAPLPE